jgi:hypothetical protein
MDYLIFFTYWNCWIEINGIELFIEFDKKNMSREDYKKYRKSIKHIISDKHIYKVEGNKITIFVNF